MAHTNINLDFYGNRDKMADKIAELEFKLKRAEDKINYLQSEFENIPDAIERYGYVDLKLNGGQVITLVRLTKKEPQGGADE